MSVQEKKSQLIMLVEHTENEPGLDLLLEQAAYILSSPQRDILDDLTPTQLAGLERARQEGRAGKYTTLADFKKEVSQWLKSA